MTIGAFVRIDPVRMFQATNASGTGQVNTYMRRLAVKTADHLQRNAPRNRLGNELHRSTVPRYADSFTTSNYGNNRGSGFRVGNLVFHALIVEEDRQASPRAQYFSWVNGTVKTPRWYDGTKGRAGTHYMERTTERYVARQSS